MPLRPIVLPRTLLLLAGIVVVGAVCLCGPGAAHAGESSKGKRAAADDADGDAAALRSVAGDVEAAYRLALRAEHEKNKALATKALELVIQLDPDHRAARRALGYEYVNSRWLRGDALYRARGFVRYNDRWMTSREFADATRPQRKAAEQKRGEAKVLAQLARVTDVSPDVVAAAKRAIASMDNRFKLGPMAQALRCEPPELRVYAANSLGRMADPLAVPALLKRAIHDDQEIVRNASVDALRAIDSPATVVPLGRALESRHLGVRVNAANALARLDDIGGMPLIIKRWVGRSGDFPRVYFAQMNQLSYIQDFDVEVAQTSFIADPIVGVLQEGVVHSHKILATEYSFTTVEAPAYRGALAKLAGVDEGHQVASWVKLWRAEGERLMTERAEGYSKRAKARQRAGQRPASPTPSSADSKPAKSKSAESAATR